MRLTTYITNHYHDKITLATSPKEVGISRNKCYELFQRFTNSIPTKYLTIYKINKSIQLLINSHLSISEISSLCGFSTPSYLTSVFEKYKGKKPKDIRN